MLCFRRVLDLNTGADHKIVAFCVRVSTPDSTERLAFHQKSHCISN